LKKLAALVLIITSASIAAATESLATRAEVTTRPLMGVCTAGQFHHAQLGMEYWKHEPFYAAVKELGADFVNVGIWPETGAGTKNAEATLQRLTSTDVAMRSHGLRYTFALEASNWQPRAEVDPGVNEYAHSNGRHFWLMRKEWFQPFLPPKQTHPALLAIVYDEAEHMQLSNNKFSDPPRETFDKPFFANTHGLQLPEAWRQLTAESRKIRDHYGPHVRLNTEQVWPDLFHIFARAGWNAAPKLLKESLSSVVLATALGAALQYSTASPQSEFWVSPDLWNGAAYPGHSPRALRSALMMGSWLGADAIYVENMDYVGTPQRHPSAVTSGSLVHWKNKDDFELTAHGRVYRQFVKEYMPANPRSVNWRTYRPRIAIIRLPDGGWGQFPAGPDHGEPPSRNRLLGNRDMPLDEPASEWLHVWPILTHGAAKPGAISYHNPMAYPKQQDFFVPIDSVAVFDHTVTGKVLDSVECFVLCGHALTPETFNDVRQRVSSGRTAIISRRLLATVHPHSASLNGNWIIVDDFKDPAVAKALKPFLGPPDVARFDFADQTVEFTKGAQSDAIEVKVVPRRQ
jgi:hypothetical protein